MTYRRPDLFKNLGNFLFENIAVRVDPTIDILSASDLSGYLVPLFSVSGWHRAELLLIFSKLGKRIWLTLPLLLRVI